MSDICNVPGNENNTKESKIFQLILTIITVLLVVAWMLFSVIFVKNDEKTENSDTNNVDYESLIPNYRDFFKETEFEAVTSDNQYIVYIDYTSEDEWNNYIEECKNMNYWTNDIYQSNYSWYSNSNDNLYKIMLDRYGEKNEYMTIIIKNIE